MEPGKPIKAFLVCTGVGIMNRGVESLFREAMDGLRGTPGLDVMLYKGRGEVKRDEKILWCISRTTWLAKFIGRCINRPPYVVEQLSSVIPFIRQIRKHQPDIIYIHDANLSMRLWKYRKQIGGSYKMVFVNGGPLEPPYTEPHHIQQLTPFYYERAMTAGEKPERHTLVPLGITVPEGTAFVPLVEQQRLRRELGLPTDRKILLSVGWIAAEHKRMHYVIEEVAMLPPEQRPFLAMIGAIDEKTPPIIAQANRQLGEGNFVARSVSYEKMPQYYDAADTFVLASLLEGFGRVYTEALIHGLPVIAYDHAIMRYVVGEEGVFVDMAAKGALATVLPAVLAQPRTAGDADRRRQSVRDRFSWSVLAPQYLEMFRKVCEQAPS